MIIALIKRNLLRFFRDKMTVFFSLLSVFILIALYVLFLANVQVNMILEMVEKESGGLASVLKQDASAFVNTWLMAGIMLTAIVNAVLSATQNFVRDQETGISKDIALTPLSKTKLATSYIISNYLIAGILSATVFSIYFTVLVIMRVPFMGVVNLLVTQVLLHVVVFMFTSLITYLVSFVKQTSVLSAICTITGVFTGFFAGIYLPMGAFPSVVRSVLGLLPFAHAASLFRSFIMQGSLQPIYLNEHIGKELTSYFGVQVEVFGYMVPIYVSAIYVVALGAIFFLLTLTRMSKKI